MGARRNIDMATGALRELRGCPEREAVRELSLAGRETGLGTQRIARALINVLADESGRVTDPDRVAAVGRWRHLLAARADTAPQDNPAVVAATSRFGMAGQRLRQVLAARNDRWRLRRLTSLPAHRSVGLKPVGRCVGVELLL